MAQFTWTLDDGKQHKPVTDDKSLRVFTVSYSGNRNSPRIVITADWLRRAGFDVGDHVIVAISKGRIVFRTIESELVEDLLR